MAALRKCKAEVTYQCPNWDLCNEMQYSGMRAGKNTCRFCSKRGKSARCLLHDEVLTVNEDGSVKKCRKCTGHTSGLISQKVTSDLTASSSPKIDVKQLVKVTADNMQKMMKQLLNEGYPIEMAMKAAHDTIVKGGW